MALKFVLPTLLAVGAHGDEAKAADSTTRTPSRSVLIPLKTGEHTHHDSDTETRTVWPEKGLELTSDYDETWQNDKNEKFIIDLAELDTDKFEPKNTENAKFIIDLKDLNMDEFEQKTTEAFVEYTENEDDDGGLGIGVEKGEPVTITYAEGGDDSHGEKNDGLKVSSDSDETGKHDDKNAKFIIDLAELDTDEFEPKSTENAKFIIDLADLDMDEFEPKETEGSVAYTENDDDDGGLGIGVEKGEPVTITYAEAQYP